MSDWVKEYKRMMKAQRQFERIVEGNRDAIMRQQEIAAGEFDLDPFTGALASVIDVVGLLFGKKKK